MPQPLVVEKEETPLTSDRTAERGSKIISHQMIRRVHVIKSPRVEDVVAQKLIGRAVKFVCARSRRDIDLAAARASHFGSVASSHNLKFLHSVRRRTQVQSVESGIGIRCSIQQEISCVWAIAADADRRALTRAPVQ